MLMIITIKIWLTPQKDINQINVAWLSNSLYIIDTIWCQYLHNAQTPHILCIFLTHSSPYRDTSLRIDMTSLSGVQNAKRASYKTKCKICEWNSIWLGWSWDYISAAVNFQFIESLSKCSASNFRRCQGLRHRLWLLFLKVVLLLQAKENLHIVWKSAPGPSLLSVAILTDFQVAPNSGKALDSHDSWFT